jgi:uncharacterized short protein YbdD (DUF466 family)
MTPQRIIEGLRHRVASLRRSMLRLDPYRRYLAHHFSHHGDTPPLDRRAFYLRQQKRKWSGISRCC